MISVELDIYSGLPNPTWTLSKKQEKELLDRVLSQPSTVKSVDSVGSYLGYRGLVVRFSGDDDGPWAQARTALTKKAQQGKLSQNELMLPDAFRVWGSPEGNNAERWLKSDSEQNQHVAELLDGFKDDLSANDMPLIKDNASLSRIQNPSSTDGNVWGLCRSAYYGGSLEVNNWSKTWNQVTKNPTPTAYGVGYQFANNCYRYASAKLFQSTTAYAGFACPGKASGLFSNGLWDPSSTKKNPGIPLISVANIKNGVYKDGWVDNCNGNNIVTMAAVAMIMGEGSGSAKNTMSDYHFYRVIGVDTTNYCRWAHKPGQTPATLVDNSGKAIYNPINADRSYNLGGGKKALGYSNFIGYFYWDYSKTRVA